jgi:hypothetical protein
MSCSSTYYLFPVLPALVVPLLAGECRPQPAIDDRDTLLAFKKD